MATALGALDAHERAALTFVPTGVGGGAPLRCYAPAAAAAGAAGLFVYAAQFAARAPRAPPPDAPRCAADAPLELRGELRAEQRAACERALAALDARGAAMLAMPTGAGKTVVALAVAAALATPTLVVVHRAALKAQWAERIGAWCGDAAGARFEVVMIQTLARRGVERAAERFGLVVYDEAHHLSARTFCAALMRVRTRYALALSATVERADGMHCATHAFFGEPLGGGARTELRATVVPVHVGACGVREVRAYNGAMRRATVNSARLLSDLASCAARTETVVARVGALLRAGRKALVLSHRRAHCVELAAALRAAGFVVRVLMGGSHNAPDGVDAPFDAVVGTTAAASEGFDEPRLDTLVLATPLVAVTQAVGRILRRANAHAPLVEDLVDVDLPTCARQWAARKRAYRALGHAVAAPARAPVRLVGAAAAAE
jgi:superfamily II DNA or RNA helicase